MMIIPSGKNHLVLSSLVALGALLLICWSSTPALAVSASDSLNIPGNPLLLGTGQQSSSRQDTINADVFFAEDRLKQGAWQEAAQQAELVLAKDTGNIKAHALIGLLAALGGRQVQAEKELALIKGNPSAGFYPELIAAVIHGQQGHYQDAQTLLAQVLGKEKEHPIALYYMGSLELAQGRLDQAEQAFQAVLRSSPVFPPALAGLAQDYWRTQQTEQAVAAYQKAITAEPDTLLYRQELIAIYKSTGQKEAENKAAMEMLYFLPGVRERFIEQGLELLNQGSYDEAINLANTMQAVYQKFPGGHYIKAVALIHKGQNELALTSINSLLAEGARVPKTHHEAGLCFLALGDLDKAEEQFKLVLALEPDSGRSFVFLPIIEQLRGHRDRAINGLSLMLAQKEPTVLIHYLQANNYLAEGKSQEYRIAMEQGKHLVPGLKQNSADTVSFTKNAGQIAESRNLMVLYFVNGWYEQAVRKSTLVLTAFPSDPFALWYNGQARIAQKRYADAFASLKKLAALDPTLVAVQMELGRTYALTHDTNSALAAFHKAAELSPSNAPAHNALGDLYSQSSQDEKAVQAYRKAIEIDPKSPQSYPSLALLLAEQPGHMAEALLYAEKAIELVPNDPASLDALGWVYVQQGQVERGIEKLQQSVNLRPQNASAMYHLGVGYYRNNQPVQAKRWLQAALAATGNFRGNDQAQALLKKLSVD